MTAAELRLMDALNLVRSVPSLQKHEIGSHFGGCWRHHAPCLAAYLEDFLDPGKDAA